MDIFPAAAMPDFPEDLTSEFRTDITPFDSGKENRRKRWAFPKRTLPLKYENFPQEAYEALWRHYHKMSGDYSSFYFIFPTANDWPGELVAITTGGIATFDLRSLESDPSTLTVYCDGAQTEVTLLPGSGQADSDQIRFAAAPDAGTVITADFYGRLRLTCRFNLPSGLSRSQLAYRCYSGAVSLTQVKEW